MIDGWEYGVACGGCWRKIDPPGTSEELCAKCGRPFNNLTSHRPGEQQAGRHCGRCEHLAFNYARACGPYEGALRESVLWLKDHPQLSPRLGRWLISTFTGAPDLAETDSIIPVPLHPSRLAERTFNQSELIARELSSATGLRVDTASLVRSKKTERHRLGLGARERARSLDRAFQVRAPRLIEGRALLVVDDVMTTGSTVHEIARTLFSGGARAVRVLTLARAVNELSL